MTSVDGLGVVRPVAGVGSRTLTDAAGAEPAAVPLEHEGLFSARVGVAMARHLPLLAGPSQIECQ